LGKYLPGRFLALLVRKKNIFFVVLSSAGKSYPKVMEAILASHDFFRTKSAKNSAGANICPKTGWDLT